MDPYTKAVTERGYSILYSDTWHAMGLGDILFNILSVQHGFYAKLYGINIEVFSSRTYPNPMNALEMRLDLIEDILTHHNSLNRDKFQIITCPTWGSRNALPIRYELFNTLHLDLKSSMWENIAPKVNISEGYIIFHTKLRLFSSINYRLIRRAVAEFCATFKSNYKIIILGERIFPDTDEAKLHNIQTLYSDLLPLKNNNEVLDLSVEEIYNTLDYKEYKRDLLLIKNAARNICIGLGGQLCSSLIFGRTAYCTNVDSGVTPFKVETLERDGHKCFTTISSLFSYISETYGRN